MPSLTRMDPSEHRVQVTGMIDSLKAGMCRIIIVSVLLRTLTDEER